MNFIPAILIICLFSIQFVISSSLNTSGVLYQHKMVRELS